LRSIFGKKTTGVSTEKLDKLIIKEKNSFHEEYGKYETEFQILSEENIKLKKEIEFLEKEMRKYNYMKENIQDTLYKSHMESCKEVYDTGKKFDDMVQYKTRIIKKQQNKNQDIKNSIDMLLKKLKSILVE